MTNSVIGKSAGFQTVLEQVRMVAPLGCAVLIGGETGTGKEIVARLLHDLNPTRTGAFVPVNCAAIPATLLESELFGHERGAFTGALNQKTGRFEAANRGTLFLDEIGELPLEMQPKLLRVLQEKQLERLGGSRTINVEFRLVAATNQNLSQMIQDRKFRADLFYRLNVFPISLPPLRERVDDIPLLVRHFVAMYAERFGRFIDYIPEEAMEALQSYRWPGNIRELQNFLERSVILSTGRVLKAPLAELRPGPRETAPVRTLADAQRVLIAATLRETNGVVGGRTGAAARLGLPRTTLLARMEKLGITNRVIYEAAGAPDAASAPAKAFSAAYGQSMPSPSMPSPSMPSPSMPSPSMRSPLVA